jgi:hypothetical protein
MEGTDRQTDGITDAWADMEAGHYRNEDPIVCCQIGTKCPILHDM